MPLRMAVWEAVNSLPGGSITASAHLGLTAKDLRNRMCESAKETHHINLRHFERLIYLTQDDRIAQSVSAMVGGVHLPMPSFDDLPSDDALLDDMLLVMDSVGQYGRELRKSLADGDIDRKEWHALSLKAQDIFKAVHLVQARAELFRGESDE